MDTENCSMASLSDPQRSEQAIWCSWCCSWVTPIATMDWEPTQIVPSSSCFYPAVCHSKQVRWLIQQKSIQLTKSNFLAADLVSALGFFVHLNKTYKEPAIFSYQETHHLSHLRGLGIPYPIPALGILTNFSSYGHHAALLLHRHSCASWTIWAGSCRHLS